MLCGVSASIAAIILGSASFAVPGCTLLRTDGLSYHVPGNKLRSHGKLISIDQLSETLMHIGADELSMRMCAAVVCRTVKTTHENIFAMNALCDQKEFNHKRHQQRVRLRGLGVGVLSDILLNSLNNTHGSVLCECVQASICNSETFLEAKFRVYYMWAHLQIVLDEGVRRIWPDNVGVSREEVGHNIRVQLAPSNPNILFVFGLGPKQTIASLSPS